LFDLIIQLCGQLLLLLIMFPLQRIDFLLYFFVIDHGLVDFALFLLYQLGLLELLFELFVFLFVVGYQIGLLFYLRFSFL
jgi:hypothetical protein